MTSEDFFESLTQYLKNELPFVAYRKPNADFLKAIFQKDSEIYLTKSFTETGFVFAPFDDKEAAVLIPLEDSNTIICEKSGIKEDLKKNDNEIPAFAGMTKTKQDHINLVQKGIDAIKSNQFKKVVLSRKETVPYSEINPISIFKNLLNLYESAFVYIWYHPKIGLWLGATPETLLKVEGNRFSTMALAGTQTYNGTLDVVWNEKEKEEQQIVADYIVNNINDIVSDLKVSEAETIKAGSLLHLKSKISGTLKIEIINFKEFLRKLHPTPAVCGFPKEPAKQFILDNENYNREFYTGFLGELNFKERKARNTNKRNIENSAYASVKTVSNLYVNLRCMQIKNNETILYVGGGITKDSIPENEWEETLNKAEIIKRVL